MNRWFVWLDQCKTDFNEFQKRFSRQTNSNVDQWIFFQHDDECRQFIHKGISSSREMIFITSGRLGIDLIEQFHSHQQIHSIYIYCQNICKYKRFAQSYRKILGIFSDPALLLECLIENLSKENSSIDEENIFHPKMFEWNPWSTEYPTLKLANVDPMIISIVQIESIPLKIIFSSTDQMKNIVDKNQFSIHFDLQQTSVTIGTHWNDEIHLHDFTREKSETLQSNDDQRQLRYWIYFSRNQSTFLFGLGEIRSNFEILQTKFSSEEKFRLSQLSHLHLCLNGIWKNFHRIEHFKDQIRFSYGTFSLIDPDLILRSSRNSIFDKFPLPLRRIFSEQLINFKLIELDFPQIISAIESSCRHSYGWCYQQLTQTNSIRLRKNSLIIEIFPPDFSTPIRHYRSKSGWIRLLYGSISLRLFHFLTSNSSSSKSRKEIRLDKDDITWILPEWNQTRQMKNVKTNSLAIILQYFQWNSDDQNEFDYFHDESRTIRSMRNSFDWTFDEFKEKMKDEWNEKHF